jgi:hypothetical protein
VSQSNSLDPRKSDFLGLMMQSSCFFFIFPHETRQDWNKLYGIVLMTCTAALSFFQNPALDHECNLHDSCPSKTVSRVQIRFENIRYFHTYSSLGKIILFWAHRLVTCVDLTCSGPIVVWLAIVKSNISTNYYTTGATEDAIMLLKSISCLLKYQWHTLYNNIL